MSSKLQNRHQEPVRAPVSFLRQPPGGSERLPAPCWAACTPHGTSRLTIHSSDGGFLFSLLQALVGKKKARDQKARSGVPASRGAHHLLPGFWPQTLAPAGGATGPEEDGACGDRCLRSPHLADRRAGLGQKLYVLKLSLNQKPQDSAFFVVNV